MNYLNFQLTNIKDLNMSKYTKLHNDSLSQLELEVQNHRLTQDLHSRFEYDVPVELSDSDFDFDLDVLKEFVF